MGRGLRTSWCSPALCSWMSGQPVLPGTADADFPELRPTSRWLHFSDRWLFIPAAGDCPPPPTPPRPLDPSTVFCRLCWARDGSRRSLCLPRTGAVRSAPASGSPCLKCRDHAPSANRPSRLFTCPANQTEEELRLPVTGERSSVDSLTHMKGLWPDSRDQETWLCATPNVLFQFMLEECGGGGGGPGPYSRQSQPMGWVPFLTDRTG